MKKNLNKKTKTKEEEKSAPDYELKPQDVKPQDESAPKVFGIFKRGKSSNDRRDFLKNLTGAAGLAAVGKTLTQCEDVEYEIRKSGSNCSCHVVCSCDAEEDSEKSTNESKRTSEYSGTVCTCDSVCTCNSVCTCDSVSTCSCDGDTSCSCDSHSSGGGGSHYWHPC